MYVSDLIWLVYGTNQLKGTNSSSLGLLSNTTNTGHHDPSTTKNTPPIIVTSSCCNQLRLNVINHSLMSEKLFANISWQNSSSCYEQCVTFMLWNEIIIGCKWFETVRLLHVFIRMWQSVFFSLQTAKIFSLDHSSHVPTCTINKI